MSVPVMGLLGSVGQLAVSIFVALAPLPLPLPELALFLLSFRPPHAVPTSASATMDAATRYLFPLMGCGPPSHGCCRQGWDGSAAFPSPTSADRARRAGG